MRFSSLALFVAPLTLWVYASPTQLPASDGSVARRQLPTDPIDQTLSNIQAILSGTLTGIDSALSSGQFDTILSLLQSITPSTTAPTTVADAVAALQALSATNPPNLFDYIANLEALNLIDSIDSLLTFVQGLQVGGNSMNNVNPAPPNAIYPQKCNCDAPYDVPEASLRGAIYIPPGFTYGQKPPVILFPGTGGTGYTTFIGNYIPLLTGVDYADPVWVNVPGYLLDDAQVNAEYAAYAINYIAAITQQNVTMVAWSQGNIDNQWAYKYFPCTQLVVSDHVAISADYDGTVLANFISPPGVPLPPSILQQRYLASSNFITALQTYNGDSAYVPTTSVYSGLLDEIVEPQQGTGASAFILDARNVGTSNSQVQLVCPVGELGGTFYTHEGVLANPLGFALFRDAMQNPGAGQPSRLDLTSVCSTYLTPGLDLGDFLLTENTVAIAGLAILLYTPKVLVEPTIKPYALIPPTPAAQCIPLASTTTTSSTTTSSTTTSTSTSTTTSAGTTTSTGTSTTSLSSTTTTSTTSSSTLSSTTTSLTTSATSTSTLSSGTTTSTSMTTTTSSSGSTSSTTTVSSSAIAASTSTSTTTLINTSTLSTTSTASFTSSASPTITTSATTSITSPTSITTSVMLTTVSVSSTTTTSFTSTSLSTASSATNTVATTTSSSISTSSTSTSSVVWKDRTSITATNTWNEWSLPTITTTATSTDDPWNEWSSGKTSIIQDVTVTVVTTSYTYICPTGYTVVPLTTTITVTVPASSTEVVSHASKKATTNKWTWPTSSDGIPSGFCTTTMICTTGCAKTGATTVTLTIPSTIATVTETIVPVLAASTTTTSPVVAMTSSTGNGNKLANDNANSNNGENWSTWSSAVETVSTSSPVKNIAASTVTSSEQTTASNPVQSSNVIKSFTGSASSSRSTGLFSIFAFGVTITTILCSISASSIWL